MSVSSFFASIHYSPRHLDWSHEVEIVVAKLVGKLLDLRSREVGLVLNYVEMNWTRSCDCRLIRYHEIIEATLSSCVLNDALVYDCARGRVFELIMV